MKFDFFVQIIHLMMANNLLNHVLTLNDLFSKFRQDIYWTEKIEH